mgnify:CR=1 FL=1
MEVFSNDVIQLIVFFNQLPEEAQERIIFLLQIILIVTEVIVFFYIRHITKDY